MPFYLSWATTIGSHRDVFFCKHEALAGCKLEVQRHGDLTGGQLLLHRPVREIGSCFLKGQVAGSLHSGCRIMCAGQSLTSSGELATRKRCTSGAWLVLLLRISMFLFFLSAKTCLEATSEGQRRAEAQQCPPYCCSKRPM